MRIGSDLTGEIGNLRDLQRACALDKVRKRLGVTRASIGSLSESVAIFDPAPLKVDPWGSLLRS